MKATGLAGGAFTFAMLNDHHAYAASETPMTSELHLIVKQLQIKTQPQLQSLKPQQLSIFQVKQVPPKMLHLVQIQQKKYFIIYNR